MGIDFNESPLPDLAAAVAADLLARRLVELARDEDLGAAGDVTSASCIPAGARGTAGLAARVPGVIAGLHLVPLVIESFRAEVTVEANVREGHRVGAGVRVATLHGRTRDLLAIERTLLNLLSRLSGVATRTADFIGALPTRTRTKLYDTRKTTPGLRIFEKYAVRCGGGMCHRLGLHDAVLIKDNHLAGVPIADVARFVADAAGRARDAARSAGRPAPAFVEVEVTSLEQLGPLLSLPERTIDAVLLDNMSEDALREAAALRARANPGVLLEASGGVTLETIEGIAQTGVDRISTGSITHHAVWMDLALDFA